ncbi:hypothetical protein C6A77_22895 [Pseudomonas sp. AFG_SD02_1510_Pfu_092]|nr:hypothetical protein C6A77_22895 [Pseudomonas sp. AFG_SD02_1510_Pfu_092]
MDGLRAVFERATLSQHPLLFRRLARSKRSNDMTGGLGCQPRPLRGHARSHRCSADLVGAGAPAKKQH